MSTITPIETRYAGYRFRSRREARWAVFLDHLGIPWQYEPEGYDLGDGILYLPDFLVYPNTDHAFWFEVKGQFPTAHEVEKALRLAEMTGTPAFVYFGDLQVEAPHLATMSESQYYDFAQQYVWLNDRGWVADQHLRGWEVGLTPTAYRCNPLNKGRRQVPSTGFWWWTDCWHCGRVLMKFEGQIGWCPSFGDEIPPSAEPLYPQFAHATSRLEGAFRAARSARFEHGERG